MLHVFNQSEIKAIVGITGKQIYDAAELCEKYAELDHKKALRLIKSVGFKKVRYLPFATTTSDACVIGAQKIFKDLNVDPKSIDGLIMVTQCPDYLVPATSYTMQQRLGLNSETLLLDLTQGCTGFVYGLMVANSLIETQVCSNILVCVGDVSQSINLHNGMFLDQKSNLSVFADGAGVALISRNQKANKSSYFSIENNGELNQAICNANLGFRYLLSDKFDLKDASKLLAGTKIDGAILADYILKVVTKDLARLLDFANLKYEDLSYCIAHQANKTLMNALASVANMPDGFQPFLAENTGNTSSASIPLALSENKDLLPKIREKNTILTGFGVGMCVGSAIVDLTETTILDAIYL